MSPPRFETKEDTMNWDLVEGNWKQFKGTVKRAWGKLTDDQLDAIAGKRDRLMRTVQEAYGLTSDQAQVQVEAFEALHEETFEPTVVRRRSPILPGDAPSALSACVAG
jgi:uncharacterized protein YjbJ (UPF0337 family)